MIIQLREKTGIREIDTNKFTVTQLKDMGFGEFPEVKKRILKEQYALASTFEQKLAVIEKVLELK